MQGLFSITGAYFIICRDIEWGKRYKHGWIMNSLDFNSQGLFWDGYVYMWNEERWSSACLW